MVYASINPGNGDPFLSISIMGDDSVWLVVRDITPEDLHRLGDELAAERSKADRRKRIEAAMDAEVPA